MLQEKGVHVHVRVHVCVHVCFLGKGLDQQVWKRGLWGFRVAALYHPIQKYYVYVLSQ